MFTRTQRECVITTPSLVCGLSTIRRTVWDGSQELVEIQQPGHTGTSAAVLENDTAFATRLPIYQPSILNADLNRFYGRVAYTVGPSLDQPLSITRWAYQADSAGQLAKWPEPFTIVPHWNVRGEADNGAFADGSIQNCASTIPSRCLRVAWPFGWSANQQKVFQVAAWHGSLLEQKRDGSGLLFRRNRYVDPGTGKFTQEDPIGFSGGLNLYEFASGDPVSFGDPFGLCPLTHSDEDCLQLLANWAAANGHTTVLNVAAAGAALGAIVDATFGSGGCEGTTINGQPVACGGAPSGARIWSGLQSASAGLKGLFAETGGLADETVIGARTILKGNGFVMRLADNLKGYVFSNGSGEEVRLMRGATGWYMRVKNAANNYLDAMGNPGPNATTHLPLKNQ